MKRASLALIIAMSLVGAGGAAAAEVRAVTENEILVELEGCWKKEAKESSEGGFYRMCFVTSGDVDLLVYNKFFAETLLGSAQFVVRHQKLEITWTAEEAWSFARSHVECSILINPHAELSLYDCVGEGADVGLAIGEKGGQDIVDSRWEYDAEAIKY